MTKRDDWVLDMSAGPIFEQIARNVRRMLARGALRPGDKLPSSRDLAGTLNVNPNTVVHGYGALEAMGIIEKRRGLGTFVREDASVVTMKQEMLGEIAVRFAAEARGLGVGADEAVAALREAWDAR